MTVEEAIKHIRRTGVDKETIYTCYVTEPNRKLIGFVSIRTLLISQDDDRIGDIMTKTSSRCTRWTIRRKCAEIQQIRLCRLPVWIRKGGWWASSP